MYAISLGVLIVLGFLGALFFILRQVILWYWRVNEIVTRLQSIDESLQCLPAVRAMRAERHRRQGRAA